MGKFSSLEEVNSQYLDVLKEIGNVGAGNATTAIANMLGLKIDMKVPSVKLLSFQEMGSAICPEEEVICGIFLGVTDDIEGSMMFLMRLESARYLVNILMMSPDNDSTEFNEMEPERPGDHDEPQDPAVGAPSGDRYGGFDPVGARDHVRPVRGQLPDDLHRVRG